MYRCFCLIWLALGCRAQTSTVTYQCYQDTGAQKGEEDSGGSDTGVEDTGESDTDPPDESYACYPDLDDDGHGAYGSSLTEFASSCEGQNEGGHAWSDNDEDYCDSEPSAWSEEGCLFTLCGRMVATDDGSEVEMFNTPRLSTSADTPGGFDYPFEWGSVLYFEFTAVDETCTSLQMERLLVDCTYTDEQSTGWVEALLDFDQRPPELHRLTEEEGSAVLEYRGNYFPVGEGWFRLEFSRGSPQIPAGETHTFALYVSTLTASTGDRLLCEVVQNTVRVDDGINGTQDIAHEAIPGALHTFR